MSNTNGSMRDAAEAAMRDKKAREVRQDRENQIPAEVDAAEATAAEAIAAEVSIDDAMAGEIAVEHASALTQKSFIPDVDELRRLMIGKKPNEVMIKLGRIIGAATGFERKETQWEGKTLPSVCLMGQFSGLVHGTGEMIKSDRIFLPIRFGNDVASGLAANPGSKADFDVELAVFSTGKATLYSYKIVEYIKQGDAAKMLARLKAPRNVINQRPEAPLLTNAAQ